MTKKDDTVKELATRVAQKVASDKAIEEFKNLVEQYGSQVKKQIEEGKKEAGSNTIEQTNDIIKQQYPESGYIGIMTKSGEISLPYDLNATFTIKLNKEGSDYYEELVYNVSDFELLNLRELLTKIKEYDYCEILADNTRQVGFYNKDIFNETINLQSSRYEKTYHRKFFGFAKTSEMVAIFKNTAFFE